MAGLKHFHHRKEKNHVKKPCCRKDLACFLDKFIYFIGISGPIMSLPQIHKIWIEKNATGVSAITWTAYMFIAIFWILYGVAHKEKPIVFTYFLWIVCDAIIVFGTVLYG